VGRIMRTATPPDRNTRPPRFKLPAGACDTHLHVYGPFDRYPLSPDRHYDPAPDCTLDDYLKVHRTLGLERAVIVTGSANGTNNQITLDTLARMNGSFKAIALLGADVSDAELHRLKAGGFSGFRIKSSGRGYTLLKDTQRMVERTREFDWHVEFMVQSLQEAIATTAFLSSLKVPYVFDHVAHAEPDQHKHGRKEFAERRARLDQSLQLLPAVKVGLARLRRHGRSHSSDHRCAARSRHLGQQLAAPEHQRANSQ
jgi:2-pyrone-4,6-dicarboxylate lactonase